MVQQQRIDRQKKLRLLLNLNMPLRWGRLRRLGKLAYARQFYYRETRRAEFLLFLTGHIGQDLYDLFFLSLRGRIPSTKKGA